MDGVVSHRSSRNSIHSSSFSSFQSRPTVTEIDSPPHTGQSGRFSCSNVNVYNESFPTYWG